MNNLEILKMLEEKFKPTIDVPHSVFIDGKWGIGKTEIIKQFQIKIKISKPYLKVYYISLFGKNTFKEIETEIINKVLFPKFSKAQNGGGAHLFKQFSKDVLKGIAKNKTGIELDIFSYMKSLSLENIAFGSDMIFIFDDLERLTNQIQLRVVLGSIEKVSLKSSVIIIGNYSEIGHIKKDSNPNENNNKPEKNLIQLEFDKFKEKIINREYKYLKNNNSVFNSIIEKYWDDETVSYFDKDYLISYFEKCGKSNLRTFIKILLLLKEIMPKLKEEPLFKNFQKEIIRVSSALIIEMYSGTNKIDMSCIEDSKKSNDLFKTFREINLKHDYGLFGTIDLLLMEILFEYLSKNKLNLQRFKTQVNPEKLEIQKDIDQLNTYFFYSDEQIEIIVNKIVEKIKETNIDYFIDQEKIVELIVHLEIVLNDMEWQDLYTELKENIPFISQIANELSIVSKNDLMSIIHRKSYIKEINLYFSNQLINQINLNNDKRDSEEKLNTFKNALTKKEYRKCYEALTVDSFNVGYIELLKSIKKEIIAPILDPEIDSNYWSLIHFLFPLIYEKDDILMDLDSNSIKKIV